MCVPIVMDTPELSDEDLKRIQDEAGTANPTAAGGNTTTPAGGRTVPGKAEGGTVTEAGNTASGGLTPAEQLGQVVQGQLADLAGSNTLLQQQITSQAEGFQSVAQGILDSQNMAANALKDGFLSLTDQQNKALKAADDLRKNTGQAQRKPNYSLKLKENAKANRTGLATTMLTGLGGVDTASLTLGKASLLGGSN